MPKSMTQWKDAVFFTIWKQKSQWGIRRFQSFMVSKLGRPESRPFLLIGDCTEQ